jgi:dihydrolipoamide dehydrogenase
VKYDYDIVVIGGGPGGYVTAIYGAQQGKKVCLIEKDTLGGVCLNRGCIPTKTLIKSVNVLDTVRESIKYGVLGIEKNNCFLDLKRVQNRKKEIVRRLTSGVSYLLRANGVDVIKKEATFKNEHTVDVNGGYLTAENIIIATGSSPAELSVQIEGDVPLVNSDAVLELEEVPERMVIIGGGVIGVEFAYILGKLGSQVTVIEALDEILPTVDGEIARKARKVLENIPVNVVPGAQVTKFVKNEVFYEKDGQLKSIKADKILVSIGRRPNVDGLNLKSLDLDFSKTGIEVNDFLRTNVENIYAIGDVNSKYMLAHVASMEGIVAINNICGRKMKIDYQKVPQCIYLHPEIASVGLTEKEALERGLDIKIGRFNYSANGKAIIEGDEEGIAKVIVDQRVGEILGVHIFGSNATDMIGEAVLAMTLESTAEEVVFAIHPHPTISEVIPEAFHAVFQKAIHAV